MIKMGTESKSKLTSTELGTLWVTYTSLTARLIIFDLFKDKIGDEDSKRRQMDKLDMCNVYGKDVCVGMRISEGKLQEVTNGIVIDEPMVVEEVINDNYSKNRSEKSFRIIPFTEYFKFRSNGK